MPRSTLLIVMMFGLLVSYGQNISVTFTGIGAATQIDSITATNLRTNQSVTLPGNQTLVLSVNTGIPSVSELTSQGMVYPNPFSGKATFTTVVQKPQTVYLKVQNLVGQIIAQSKAIVPPGENEFSLSITTAGIYLISLTTEEGTVSYKVICTDASETENSIQYNGIASNSDQNSAHSGLKSFETGYALGYTPGDIIHYRCRSGIFTSLLTDSPASSKDYTVVFAACTDPDGKNYSIVTIGSQTWMAENLAWLPAVSPSSAGSETTPYYYVYGYEGSTVALAKVVANFTSYGVLYNWPAALTACPSGWYLPTDEEWKTLEMNQGMSQSDADATGWRDTGTVGGKLKEAGISHWDIPNTGATNTSGFTVLPGGLRYDGGGFDGLAYAASFWSSSEGDASRAWGRDLYYDINGVLRGYHYRYYGFSVRCLLGQVVGLATVSTTEITAITETSASGGGNVTSDGGNVVTAKGVCWNTNETPTTSDSKTINGTGTGVFTSSISGLTAGTPYYVRAYATNSVGTAYGVAKQFTTTGGGGDGTFTDPRDGHNYLYKTIGTQTWMTENLAYLPSVNPYSASSDTTPYNYVYGYNGTTVSAAKATANYTTYGVLYNWPAAMNGAASSTSVPSGVQGICPPGWYLPSDAEWTVLTDYLTNNGYGYGGSGSGIGKSMASTSGWTSYSAAGTIGNNQASNNSSGFTALPGGYSYFVGFDTLGDIAVFWSASGGPSVAWVRQLGYDYDGVGQNGGVRNVGFSVRCLQN